MNVESVTISKDGDRYMMTHGAPKPETIKRLYNHGYITTSEAQAWYQAVMGQATEKEIKTVRKIMNQCGILVIDQ